MVQTKRSYVFPFYKYFYANVKIKLCILSKLDVIALIIDKTCIHYNLHFIFLLAEFIALIKYIIFVKVKLYIYSVVLFLSLCYNATAQVAPKYSNEFLAIGVGARSFSMANATVASVTGVDAVYWNPAALNSIKHNVNLGLMHSEYFAGLAKYDFGALAFKPDESSAFGISLIRFGVDDIPNTTDLIDSDGNIRFDRIKSFSVADYAFTLSYSRKLPIEGLDIGANAKVIRRIGGEFASAWGFGIDVAARFLYRNWHFGLMARDITTTFNSWNYNTESLEEVFLMTGNEIPSNTTEITLPKFILGAAYTYKFSRKFAALAELNLDITTDGKRNTLIKGDHFSIDPHMGVELNYNKLVYLRFGVGNLQTEYNIDGKSSTTCQPNIGLGLKYKKLTIDYALTDIGNVSAAGYSHVFSLSYVIDKNDIKPKTNVE